MKRMVFFLLLFGLMVSACSGESGIGAATAAEQYISALGAKDKALITNLSCKEWEESAILEVDALLSVEAEINDLSCEVKGEEGDNTLVICNGTLDLTYNDEIREIDLSRQTYYLQQTSGQWQVCAYK